MAAYVGPFLAALKTAIGTVWADCVDNGIYLAPQVATLDLARKAQDGEMPFAVISGRLPEGDWGMTNDTVDGLLRVYRVTTDAESVDALLANCEALRDYLADTGPSEGQIIGHPWVDWSEEQPLYSYFLRTRQPYLTMSVVGRVVAGETA